MKSKLIMTEELRALANQIDEETMQATTTALERWMNENSVGPTPLLMVAAHHLGRIGRGDNDDDFEEALALVHNLIDWFAHDGRAHAEEEIAS